MPMSTVKPRVETLVRSTLVRCGLAALIVAAAGAGGAALAALPGLTCKTDWFRGTGFHYSKNGAHKMALIQWIEKVTAVYGQSWARWGRSAQRSVSCTHNPSPSQHGWYCVVRARPCRYVNPGVTPHRFRTPHPARPRLRRQRRELQRQPRPFRRQ